jgi:hypothetical protein
LESTWTPTYNFWPDIVEWVWVERSGSIFLSILGALPKDTSAPAFRSERRPLASKERNSHKTKESAANKLISIDSHIALHWFCDFSFLSTVRR